jgi:Protein of unknown function (DUF1236)/FHA domain
MSMALSERINPYVGPRAFGPGEALYGRDREVVDLLDLLIAERIVVLCSPSGAGKTSLIQAALLPKLVAESFEVLPIMRVSQVAAPGTRSSSGANRYVRSAMLYLERSTPDEGRLEALARLDFAAYLAQYEAAGGHQLPSVLIFDQFEEVLTLDQTDREDKAAFFDQVGIALRDRRRWALFAIREDFLGALEPYLDLVPTGLQTRYRLDLLDEAAALKAVRLPARSEHVNFTEDAARLLVNDLRQVQVQTPAGNIERRAGPYVEPVVLQVVCERLWDRLPPNSDEITSEHVRTIGSVDTALSDYYAEKLAGIAAETSVTERTIRVWFERQLITEQGTRGQVMQEPGRSRGLDNRVIAKLVDAHLVRAEQRLGTTWFELAHDRLIDPVHKSNAEWYRATLNPFQIQADVWERNNRPDGMLISGESLTQAEAWIAAQEEVAAHEIDFIENCLKARKMANRERGFRWAINLLSLGLMILLLTVVRYWFDQFQEVRPWAVMSNLVTGDPYPLQGAAGISVGRSAGEIESGVNVLAQAVSRVHLYIDRNGKAFDARSLNGTTLNAKFMFYGDVAHLQDGDILVLAGVAAFQFRWIKYKTLQFWAPRLEVETPPADAWGVLIDGTKRSIHYLTAKSTTLALGKDGELVFDVPKGQKPLLQVVQGSDAVLDVALTVESGTTSLVADFKAGDYTYISCLVPTGSRIVGLDEQELFHTGQCGVLDGRVADEPIRLISYPSLSGVPFSYGTTRFEIIAFPLALSISQQNVLSKMIAAKTPMTLGSDEIGLAIGQKVPESVPLEALAPEAEALAPQLHGLHYLAIDDRIAIVDPRTRRILSVMQRGRR